MTQNGWSRCTHSIGRMESTIAAHNLILKQGPDRLLVTIAQSIVHGELERHFEAQVRKESEKVEPKNVEVAQRQEQTLLSELAVLDKWRNGESKAME